MTHPILAAAVATGVMLVAACQQPAQPHAEPAAPATTIIPTASADIPDAVRAAALAARPGMQIEEAELKERDGRRYYDVEGALNGEEIELDLLETPQGWQVVEIQRDIAWAAVPAAVKTAAQRTRAGFTPVRVIESKQATSDDIIYELFADGQPATPALEVKLEGDGDVEVLKQAWPH